VASVTLVVPHLSKRRRTLLRSKGTAGNKSCVNVSSPLVTSTLTFTLPYILLLVFSSLRVIFVRSLRLHKAESPAYLSAAYFLGSINLCKRIIFHYVEPKTCQRLKFVVYLFTPPSRYPFDLALSFGIRAPGLLSYLGFTA